MTQHDDPGFDSRLADWLERDPERAPYQVLMTALAAFPSIPQRRVAPRWRRVLVATPLARLAAAAVVVVVVGGLGLALRGPLNVAGPGPTPTRDAAPTPFPQAIDVPARYYSVRVPSGWGATLGVGLAAPDVYAGPEGTVSLSFELIPSGTSQDQWVSAQYQTHVARLGGSCLPGKPDAWDYTRFGMQPGSLFAMPCLPGWMALTVVGDRGYDVQFSAAGPGGASAQARAMFEQILAGLTLSQGPTVVTPSGSLSP